MLVVSEKRLVPAHINTIVLQGDDGMYYYMHRDFYDQMVVLTDTYVHGDKISVLTQKLFGKDFTEFPANVLDFYDRVPWPVKMAAPFLLLVNKVEQLTEFIDLVGAVSVMSMSLNMRMMTKLPKEVLAAVTFSLHVREEYQPTWDRFFQENPEYGVQVTIPAPVPTVRTIETPTGPVMVDEETGEEAEVVTTDDDLPPGMFDSFMDSLAGMSSSDEEDEEEEEPEDSTAGGGSGFSALEGL